VMNMRLRIFSSRSTSFSVIISNIRNWSTFLFLLSPSDVCLSKHCIFAQLHSCVCLSVCLSVCPVCLTTTTFKQLHKHQQGGNIQTYIS
jgi:hypothetical protein